MTYSAAARSLCYDVSRNSDLVHRLLDASLSATDLLDLPKWELAPKHVRDRKDEHRKAGAKAVVRQGEDVQTEDLKDRCFNCQHCLPCKFRFKDRGHC